MQDHYKPRYKGKKQYPRAALESLIVSKVMKEGSEHLEDFIRKQGAP